MTVDDLYPEPSAGRPVWLVTLADLALLLVGFFVFMEAGRPGDAHAIAGSIRARFGGQVTAPAMPAPPPPVAIAAMPGFAPGSAVLPSSPAALVAWSREVTRDPRVSLRIVGTFDGSAADVDPQTRSGAVLAADRARAIAAALALAGAVPPGRVGIATAVNRRSQVTLTIAYAGAPASGD